MGNAGHALDAGGDHDVLGAAHHGLGREVQGLLGGAALTVHRRGGYALRQARGQNRVARDVGGLLAHLHDAAHDHVLDTLGIDARAVHQLVQDHRAQVGGVPFAQAAALTATGGACCGDDVRSLGHVSQLLEIWCAGTPRVRTNV
jgi:hypothetical protein